MPEGKTWSNLIIPGSAKTPARRPRPGHPTGGITMKAFHLISDTNLS